MITERIIFVSRGITTCLIQLYLMVEVYLHLLPKVQLHVSAFGNSHLQVVHESLESSYTRFNPLALEPDIYSSAHRLCKM